MAYNFFVHSDLVFGKDAAAALSGILENENIKNVAITGPYGSGKSSLIESYEIKVKKEQKEKEE